MSKVAERHKQELNPNVTLLEYRNSKDATYECSIHGIFVGMPYMIRRYAHQCSKCRQNNHHNRLTHADYVKVLKEKHPHYRVLDTYVNNRTALRHKCTRHKTTFSIVAGGVLDGASIGCTKCKTEKRSIPRVSEAAFLERLAEVETPIVYVEGFTRMKAKATFKCTDHNFEWDALPENVLAGHKCPACKQESNASSYTRTKEFSFHGRVLTVQGYEPIVLEYLAKKLDPKDICVSKEGGLPGYNYTFQSKARIGFPDFYITSKKRYVEVKSSYTFWRDYLKNKAKARGASETNFKMDWYIAWEDGRVIKLPKDWFLLGKPELKRLF